MFSDIFSSSKLGLKAISQSGKNVNNVYGRKVCSMSQEPTVIALRVRVSGTDVTFLVRRPGECEDEDWVNKGDFEWEDKSRDAICEVVVAKMGRRVKVVAASEEAEDELNIKLG